MEILSFIPLFAWIILMVLIVASIIMICQHIFGKKLIDDHTKDYSDLGWSIFNIDIPDGPDFILAVKDNRLRIVKHNWKPVEIDIVTGTEFNVEIEHKVEG